MLLAASLMCHSRPSAKIGAFCSNAFSVITSSASLFCFPITTGQKGFIIPAFSPAICLIVFPRNCSWSNETGVIIVRAGRAITFVASNLPPNPTSSKT